MNAKATTSSGWPGVASIGFDRRKYGRELLVDACSIADIPTFITAPRAHRLEFYEIMLVTEGEGLLELDGSGLPVAPCRMLLTNPGEIRRWRLAAAAPASAPLGGMLAFFEAEFINGFFGDPCFLEKMPLVASGAAQRSIPIAPRAFDDLVDILGSMRDELQDVRSDSSHALRAQTYRLMVALQRLSGRQHVDAVDPARALARRFSAMVNERFSQNAQVAFYAEALGVSARHLNDCVQRATGRSASENIHARLLLEARRLLLHTNLGVGEIAMQLNFSDASYFVRFFKRHLGATPREFRLRGS